MRGTDGQNTGLSATGASENNHVAIVDSCFALAVVQRGQRIIQTHRLRRVGHQAVSGGMTAGAPTITAAAFSASIM